MLPLDETPPSRDAALARIARIRPDDYARTRNHLDGAVTGLSPYLTHGLVTTREVLAGVLQEAPLAIGHKLVFELGWREFFRHVWAHLGDGILDSLHPGPRPDADYGTTVPLDIREARTGVPVIDQAVRTLYATGTLHNHARMWLASYVVHLRHVHWRAGADWMVAHLFDGDLASNHLSWQWVAGTGSHKPYLFNAENVARYAPPHWHSPRTVIDQGYEALERIARGQAPQVTGAPGAKVRSHPSVSQEPALTSTPLVDMGVQTPDEAAARALRGREVWLVHPWALRAPPPEVPPEAAVLGVYLREHHQAWPWCEARWRWVDAAMAAVAPQRWHVDRPRLARMLAGAARVRSVGDPHITPHLRGVADLALAPALFPQVDRHCVSFSSWHKRATAGVRDAAQLLRADSD